ncbi:non-specific lipid-transfer protein 2-like [Macadamia integrifolia]|uniref:non-specific lipid-transfer protein 2-like n=1 Tax=Macadamia integrifolia TaxID=60698 RepID=UPI001C4E66A0|nr:non-specific lipid-transfer protein 2-like [Macadamia integrifolia]
MKVPYIAAACVMVVMLLLSGGQVPVAAVTCNASQLSVCANAILLSQAPTKTCCDRLEQQRPCLCTYIKDPSLQRFVSSPNAKKVASTCGVPYPQC